jgi:PleD family two-component response regulator
VCLERLRQEIGALKFESEKGPFSVTISFGAAAFAGALDAANPSLIVERATAMLQSAKRDGRDRTLCEGDSDSRSGELKSAA